jgi:hypothetical protein
MVDADQPPFEWHGCDVPCVLTAEEIAAVHAFVREVGGVENARRALETLALLQGGDS